MTLGAKNDGSSGLKIALFSKEYSTRPFFKKGVTRNFLEYNTYT